MLISKLGEFGLIERFKKSIRTDSSVIKGSGDDCAVIKFNRDKYLLFSCDMIVEGIDFLPKDKPELIGRKALAVSMSDIAACGGIPRYAVISLGISQNESVERIDRVSRGIFNLARIYKVNIVGGDLSKANCLTIDISILGMVEKKYLVLRNGAKKGDIIFVSGSLGGSSSGRHLTFIPRLKEARFLVRNFKINAMIDISDGLTQDLGHILKESKVGAVIYEDLIPLSKQADNLNDALFGGEDFELLFTAPHDTARKLLKSRRADFKPIGEIVEKKHGLALISRKGTKKIIEPKGFQHF